jgi:hypothetical protein
LAIDLAEAFWVSLGCLLGLLPSRHNRRPAIAGRIDAALLALEESYN